MERSNLSHHYQGDVFTPGLTWVAGTQWHAKDSTYGFVYAIDVCMFKPSPECLPGQDTYLFLHDLGL